MPAFRISLAAWSLHREFFAREISLAGMIRYAGDLGITGFEFVNTFFKAPQYGYVRGLGATAEKAGVQPLLIMCDAEGDLASPDPDERAQAVRNHRKWVDIAAVLGCHALRVNASPWSAEPSDMAAAADSLCRLADMGVPDGISVAVENHGGLSSDPDVLVPLIHSIGRDDVGTLPDFGNFPEAVDRYAAVATMMPYAKAVSAKCYDFVDGRETTIDFPRMLDIVTGAGYDGYVGIEYEGQRLPEREGIAEALEVLRGLGGQ